MTGKYAAAAEQAIARTALYNPDYIEHAAHALAARMLRAFAEILDADNGESAIPATVSADLDSSDEEFAARLREIVRRRGGNVQVAFGSDR